MYRLFVLEGTQLTQTISSTCILQNELTGKHVTDTVLSAGLWYVLVKRLHWRAKVPSSTLNL